MMTSLSPAPPWQKAIQFFLAIITILFIGKLISMVPVMSRLHLAGTYKAAEIVWFSAKLSALVIFYYFARATISAIPNNGGILSFLRNIAEPLTILIIVIIGQELLWQIIEPFIHNTGKKIYFSIAILSIVCISIWLVLKTSQSALYLFEASQHIAKYLSRFAPNAIQTCAACGNQLKNHAIFCSHCGIKTVEQTKCLECGKDLFANEKFCRHCGTAAHESL